jgi:hypothetical protein
LPLLDDLRLEGAFPVPRDGYLHRPDIGQHGLGPGAVAAVLAVLPRWVVLVVAEVVGHLAFQGRLQQPLGQLPQQPALAGQLQALGLGPVHELVDQPLFHGLPLLRLTRLDGPGGVRVLAGHLVHLP